MNPLMQDAVMVISMCETLTGSEIDSCAVQNHIPIGQNSVTRLYENRQSGALTQRSTFCYKNRGCVLVQQPIEAICMATRRLND